MSALDAVSALWPVFLGFITLVIVLAQMHSQIETLREKVRVLFDLWNSKQ